MTPTRDLSGIVAARLAAVRQSSAGNFREAVRLLEPAASARPNDAIVQLEFANALVQSGAHEKAVAAFDRAIAINGGLGTAHANRAFALNALGRHAEAEQAARRALEINPVDNAAANNLAHSVKMLGRFAESADILEGVIARDPNHVEALNNLGDCCRALGRLDRAAVLLDRAIAIKPDFAHAHVNRAFCHLQAGEWRHGFEEYEWRFSLGLPLQHRGAAARWNGEAAPGRTLYVETEQGHGDAIQFMRLAAAARARVGRLVLMGRAEQLTLLATAPGVDATVAKKERPPAEALHASLMSLPHLLGIGADGLRIDRPYLGAEAARVARWRGMLATLPGRKIGVCWQGTPGIQPDLGRSLPLAAIAPLARMPNVTLVSLQKRAGTEQLERLPAGMTVVVPPDDFDGGTDAFLDSAALIMSLERVVTVDTAIAHLAGALGRPVSLLLRRFPDWRWGFAGTETLWYPTMRLYRQETDGDWTGPLARLVADLAAA